MIAARIARAIALGGIAAGLVASPVAAQHEAGGPAGIADVPAGPATIRGVVRHGEDPDRAAGVEVLLYALPAGGAPGLRRTRSRTDGTFAFENIANDTQTAYLIGARYQDVPFPGARVGFAAGELEKTGIEIRIGEIRSDSTPITVTEVELRLAPRGGQLAVLERYRLRNDSARTVYAPAATRSGAGPALVTRLPAGATGFRVPLGLMPEGLVFADDEVSFYGPVYPSAWETPGAQDQDVSFEYQLPASPEGGIDLRKRFPAGAGRVVVLAPADADAPRIPGAREEAPQEVDGRTWRRFVRDGMPTGGELTIALEIPAQRIDPSAVARSEVRIFLELDDAALLVREEHHLIVTGDTPVVGRPGEPLLSLGMPEHATDLRFDPALFERGLSAGEDGGAVFAGPFPPGESSIDIAYHLPIPDPDAGVQLARRFDAPLPLLSIFVADTGLHFESERLHRRRPIATPDRNFLHLEAFQVDPNETIRLSLAQRQAPATPPRAILYLFVALTAGVAVAFLGAPLGRGLGSEPLEEPAEDAARHDRDAVYGALRDLEHDHETAKISDDDYASMRQELRARAATLIRESRTATPSVDPAPAAAPACPTCHAATRSGDRFCAQCGGRIETASPQEASA
ncbi:hypothetical protein KJ059_05645 [Myxococcota bacterium]|nr:hypothetical protein [Myxococcota bacterium]MCZ7620028.1 zinc ribbon domain-containing protein [Myxococcota bacterium]